MAHHWVFSDIITYCIMLTIHGQSHIAPYAYSRQGNQKSYKMKEIERKIDKNKGPFKKWLILFRT